MAKKKKRDKPRRYIMTNITYDGKIGEDRTIHFDDFKISDICTCFNVLANEKRRELTALIKESEGEI